VISNDGGGAQWVQSVQRRLEQVAGVSRVIPKESKEKSANFTVESMQDRHIRPDLARAVIESGWHLNELHAVGLSLEEIFLELTARDSAKDAPKEAETPPVAVETSGETK
jgi:hypothetical protein